MRAQNIARNDTTRRKIMRERGDRHEAALLPIA
jgi:hypothetical protein